MKRLILWRNQVVFKLKLKYKVNVMVKRLVVVLVLFVGLSIV